MSANRAPSNKAKIARRVIEVLEYFDDDHREATVMDIVRRYDRPQSSTSELLSSLVELGLLFKDQHSRSYSLAPRAALLGAAGQGRMLRDGSLVRLTDRLAAQTGLSVAVFGMVGLNVQVVSWRSAAMVKPGAERRIAGGMQLPLSESAAGWLLLSTVPQPRRDGVVRRLNAEAPEARKFSAAEFGQRLQALHASGWIDGHAGFDADVRTVAQLLPGDGGEPPMAIALVYGAEDRINPESLRTCLDQAIAQCLGETPGEPANVERLASAA